LVSVWEALPDEDRGAGTKDAAYLVRGEFEVWDVVNDEREPCGVCRVIWQR
jgi:hypothetical protein